MGRTRILVVDDEPSIRSLLHDAMSSPELEILTADSAARAMAVAENQGPVELVVTDVYMPGMDGVELAGHLAANQKAKRFLFLSGYYDIREMGSRLELFPCSAFLEKPFTIPELLRVVHGLLAEGGSAAAGAGQSLCSA